MWNPFRKKKKTYDIGQHTREGNLAKKLKRLESEEKILDLEDRISRFEGKLQQRTRGSLGDNGGGSEISLRNRLSAIKDVVFDVWGIDLDNIPDENVDPMESVILKAVGSGLQKPAIPEDITKATQKIYEQNTGKPHNQTKAFLPEIELDDNEKLIISTYRALPEGRQKQLMKFLKQHLNTAKKK